MRASFDARIARAAELAEQYPAARDLLSFYAEIARLQTSVAQDLDNRADLRALLPHFATLIEVVRRTGPEPLTEFFPEEPEKMLRDAWEGRLEDDRARFYARALLQPYAESLASRAVIDFSASTPACPFCGARPVAAVLRGEGDGGKRWLLCSLCSTEWPFRRVLCPGCGAEDKERLPVYTSEEVPHVRVEACDLCKAYIKSIDLTRDGRAVPMVDEIATVALDIWAEEHGYSKIEPNLLGM